MFVPAGLSAFSQWIFTNSLKAAVLVLLIFTIQWLLRDRLPAKWMSLLWLVLVIRLLLPSGFESGLSLYNFFRTPVETGRLELSANQLPAGPLPVIVYRTEENPGVQRVAVRRSADVLAVLWFCGAMAVALIAVAGNIRFLWRAKKRRPVKEPVLLQTLDTCRERMRIKTRIRLARLDSIRMPMLYGWLRPIILLPARYVENWTPEQLRHIFCHELAHHKRRDILLAYLIGVLQILHWFNPLLWIAFYRIRLERELACDAVALNFLGLEQSRAYGATILSMLENISKQSLLPMTVGIAESKNNLKRRLTSIVRFEKPRLLWTVLGLAVVLLTGSTALTEARHKESNLKNRGPLTLPEPEMVTEPKIKPVHNKPLPVQVSAAGDVSGSEQSAGGHVNFAAHISSSKLNSTGTLLNQNDSDEQKSFRDLEKSVHPDSRGMIFRAFRENGLYGYADTTGTVRIEPRFQMAMDFYGEIAVVQKNGKWGFIDRQGGWVVKPEFESVQQFDQTGLAAFKKDGLWGYLNGGGEVVIRPRFDLAYPFTEGLAVVQKDGKYGFIDPAGDVVIEFQYDRSQCFWNGLAAVDKNGLWGFIDKTGQTVIPCMYRSAEFFSEGLAAVEKNSLWGFINIHNEYVISPRFEAADHFSQGLAAVKPLDQKYGFIDKKGHMVIAPQYDVVLMPFENGKALVTIFENPQQGVEGRSLWIDRSGRVIGPFGPDKKGPKTGLNLQIKKDKIELNGEKIEMTNVHRAVQEHYAGYLAQSKKSKDGQKSGDGGGTVSVGFDDDVSLKRIYIVMNALAEIMHVPTSEIYQIPPKPDMTLAEYRVLRDVEETAQETGGTFLHPRPVNGWRRFYAQIPYPKAARRADWMGRIYAVVQMDASGRVESIEFPFRKHKEHSYGCYDAVEKAVQNTKWLPAKNPDGQPSSGLVEINALFPAEQWCLKPGKEDVEGWVFIDHLPEKNRYVRVPFHHLVKNSETLSVGDRILQRGRDYHTDDMMTLRFSEDVQIPEGEKIKFKFLHRQPDPIDGKGDGYWTLKRYQFTRTG